jgi:tight adherence protein B
MTPDTSLIVIFATVAVAIAATLLAWSLFDILTNGLARYRQVFTERTHFSLREMFLFIEPSRLFMINLAVMLIAAVLVLVLTGSLLLMVLAIVAVAFLPRMLLAWMRRRRLDRLEQQLPDTLMILAGGMKAGVSLTQAVQQMVAESQPPVSQEFDLVLREQRLGVTLDVALDNLNERVPLQSITLTVSAMRIASETGGQLAETLERAAQTLRNKLAMEGKIRALTAQGKLQAIVVGLLPVFLILVLNEMEPAAMSLMFTTQMGWATLGVIVLLEFFGVLLIRKIVDIDV